MKRATPVPFILLVVLALAALFLKGRPSAGHAGGPINSGDVAWMITASALIVPVRTGARKLILNSVVAAQYPRSTTVYTTAPRT